MKVSIITVTYNCQDFIDNYLKSVLRNIPQDGEIIIVDNNSSDDTVSKLEKYKDRIKFIKSDKNLGFSKGNNLVAKQANGEYLFFLNPDTMMEKNVLDEMMGFYEETPNAGLLGPKLVKPNGEVQASAKNLPTAWGAIKEFILGIKNAYSEYVPSGKEPVEVESVYGAAMLIKKELFEKLGGFDEKFFMYYEDADLCKRVRQAGKKIYYYPLVEIVHLVGAAKSDQNRYELNKEAFYKYHGWLEAILLQLIFLMQRIIRKLTVL